MSRWTHVKGIIEVSVRGRTQPEKRYILETVLEHLPRVSGSEGDMNVHIIQEEGQNIASGYDEFGNKTNNLKSIYGKKSQKYGNLSMQDKYILAVEGNLRDKTFDETKQEFMKWICRLAKRIYVYDVCVKIYSFEKSFVISDETPYMDMYEYTENWTDYLMWEEEPLGDMPIVLMNKYNMEEYVKEEISRRNKWRKRFA